MLRKCNERRKTNLIREKVSLVGENIAKKVTYSSLRCSPNITVLAEQASNYLLDRNDYPYINRSLDDIQIRIINDIMLKINEISYNSKLKLKPKKKALKFKK